MKWSLFLALASIGLVAGHDAWKKNYDYKYKLVEKIFRKTPGLDERGTIAGVMVTIRPVSDNVLIGKITEATFDDVNSDFKIDVRGSMLQEDEQSNIQPRIFWGTRSLLDRNVMTTDSSSDSSMDERKTNLRYDGIDRQSRMSWYPYHDRKVSTDSSSSDSNSKMDERKSNMRGNVDRDDLRRREMDREMNRDTTKNLKSVLQNDVPLNKEFKIVLRNGLIDSIYVDRTMTTKQINQVKFIASQFQLDTKAQNRMESRNSHLPETNSHDAYYTTMESTVLGVCETNYDISRLPEYLAYPKYDSIKSLGKFASGEDVIEIKKNTKYNNCNERSRYLLDLADKKRDNDLTMSLNTRIIITGTLDKYTIHSSVSTNKVADLSEYVYLTLESMERRDTDLNINYNTRLDDMRNIGRLVYNEETYTM